MHSSPFFRPDIEGLRALAVLLVVACHAGVPWLQGGYIGVDVFFVISGYLITRLLDTEYSRTGKIDLSGFYARRVRRLLPALALMVGAVLVAIWVFFSPFEQPVMLRSVLAASLYISNLHFAWGATDYWGADAKQDPLLHTWSLGVEEQFYLGWPPLFFLMMFLLRRSRPAVVWGAAALLLLLSFILAALWTHTRQPEAFFYPHARAWEFGVGAAFALFEARSGRFARGSRLSTTASVVLSSTGVLLIVAAAVLFGAQTAFPGVAALLPVLGTLLVIAAVSLSGGIAPKVLTLAPWQWLGRMSYGWYLWHWPLLVLGKMLWPEPMAWRQLAIVSLALALAAISYRVIELPVRQLPRFRGGRFALGMGIALPAFFVAAVMKLEVVANEAARQPEFVRFMEIRSSAPGIYAAGCDRGFDDAAVVKCIGGDESGKRVGVLLGDSHAGQWFSAFHQVFKEEGWQLVFMTKSACPIVNQAFFYERIGRIYRECEIWREAVMDSLAGMKPDLVVVSGSENYPFSDAEWRKGSLSAIGILSRSSVQVAILRDTPLPRFDVPACLARKAWQPELYATSCTYRRDGAQSARLMALHREMTGMWSNVSFLDMTPYICDLPVCNVVEGDLIKFRDGNHLSDKYVRTLTPHLRELLRSNGLLSPGME